MSDIEGVFFNEYLGGMSNKPDGFVRNGSFLKSFAGHAPHTTSPDLLVYLKNQCKKNALPFSIHVSESEEEEEFIRTGRGAWADFLRLRGIDFSLWPVTSNGSIAYLDSLGILDDRTIAVHVLRSDKKDHAVLKSNNVNVCLCPRSNFNLHGKRPDAEEMFHKQVNLCLGTDSLASTHSLSMIDEICDMNEAYSHIPPREIFRMATINGAKALGISDRFGTIEKGKSGKCFYLPVDVSVKSDVYTGFMRYKNG
jgi:cytosine/adenosine deaminase-related metal-dependent hydrolase